MLPPADWTAREDLAALVSALGEGNLRWVGGAVRDTLLGLLVKDIDAATPLRPEQVVAALKAAGIRSVPTGIDHGTITALTAGGPVEITTLRHDVSTDGRRATVAFATDWREDAERRDFTINALYADPQTLEITDYFGGIDDLAAHGNLAALVDIVVLADAGIGETAGEKPAIKLPGVRLEGRVFADQFCKAILGKAEVHVSGQLVERCAGDEL